MGNLTPADIEGAMSGSFMILLCLMLAKAFVIGLACAAFSYFRSRDQR